jgi:hypothetical protein
VDYDVFENVPVPKEGTEYSPTADFRLKEGSVAVDKGTVIPTISEKFSGAAPDLGAIEHGEAMPEYGVKGSFSAPVKLAGKE